MFQLRVSIKVGLISLTLSVASCTQLFPSSTPIPNSSETIKQIYDRHNSKTTTNWQINQSIPDGASHLDGYSREVYDELSVRFPRLPNPTIIMYIFPHLSIEDTPVPGYSTMFQMYENVEYALPNELPIP